MSMPTVGLSMIVKNGAHTLRPCLESARGIVSQIVIADTGSSDETVQIAQECGAEVLSVPWEDHFANARNAALARMKTDWVLVLDADEELDSDARFRIPELLKAIDVGGYVTPIRNYMASRFNRGWDRVGVPNDYRHDRAKNAPSYIAHENCRLFQRHPGIYFTGRIHELVEPQIRMLGLKLELENAFFIVICCARRRRKTRKISRRGRSWVYTNSSASTSPRKLCGAWIAPWHWRLRLPKRGCSAGWFISTSVDSIRPSRQSPTTRESVAPRP